MSSRPHHPGDAAETNILEESRLPLIVQQR